MEVHYKGNWKKSGFPDKVNLQSTSLDTTTIATSTTLATTSTTTTAAPPLDPSTHVFLTLALLVLFTGLLVGLAAVGLVMKTRWDRYHLHMMPLYQFERDQVVTRKLLILVAQQDDLEAELLDSPEEREPVGSSKNRRDFGT